MITPIAAERFSLPLPIFDMLKIATLTSRDGESFSIWIGADQNIAAQLREKSLDTSDVDLQQNTSDYARFGEGSYEEWYSKNRTPFALVHDATKQLAAFAWFGPKPLGRKSLKYLSDEERAKELQQKEDVWHTLVYRSYVPFRGKGIMGEFVRFTMEKYKEHYPNAKFWAGMSASNSGSIGLATKLGFMRRDDLYDATKDWVAMTIE
jgi:RimJ/RimL family protein N-acetyltransferase